MNGKYYNNSYDPITNNNIINNESQINYQNIIDNEYIDNILKLNRGKKVKLSITIPGSIENQDKTFEGILESSGKDHIILSNPNTGEWNLIPLMYLTYITFEESINYNYL